MLTLSLLLANVEQGFQIIKMQHHQSTDLGGVLCGNIVIIVSIKLNIVLLVVKVWIVWQSSNPIPV